MLDHTLRSDSERLCREDSDPRYITHAEDVKMRAFTTKVSHGPAHALCLTGSLLVISTRMSRFWPGILLVMMAEEPVLRADAQGGHTGVLPNRRSLRQAAS